MKPLTEEQRAAVIAELRREAVAVCREYGCTCWPEPRMELTEQTFGPYELPLWTSDHPDDCPAGVRFSRMANATMN